MFIFKRFVSTRNTGIDNNGSANQMLDRLCTKVGISRNDIRYTMATGYSRKVLTVADDDISEITAHVYGVRVTAPKEYRPGMIIDIGGQDSKIIYLDSGVLPGLRRLSEGIQGDGRNRGQGCL